jgi:stress-induced morphogen
MPGKHTKIDGTSPSFNGQSLFLMGKYTMENHHSMGKSNATNWKLTISSWANHGKSTMNCHEKKFANCKRVPEGNQHPQ